MIDEIETVTAYRYGDRIFDTKKKARAARAREVACDALAAVLGIDYDHQVSAEWLLMWMDENCPDQFAVVIDTMMSRRGYK